MAILVVGAGATGGYFGLRLVRSGRDLTFLVRPERAQTLRQRGLRVHGLGQDERIEPRLITSPELKHTKQPYDIVLLSVKAGALRPALADLAPAVGDRTRIVPFLNGMAHLDELDKRFGSAAVLGAVVKVLTQLDAEGDIIRLAPFASVQIGARSGPDPLLDEIAAQLSGAGFDFRVEDDILSAMWHKWVFIATIGALTCLMRAPLGDIAACPGGADLGRAVLAEAAGVSAAAGHPVPQGELASTTALVTRPGEPFASSMYRDLTAGAGTEAEHILGDLTARARDLRVPTPLLDLAALHLRVYESRRTR